MAFVALIMSADVWAGVYMSLCGSCSCHEVLMSGLGCVCLCPCVAATIKVAGCMQKSAEVLHNMNNLIKIPELSQACREMAREMEKVRNPLIGP
jgi:hypothetical protein